MLTLPLARFAAGPTDAPAMALRHSRRFAVLANGIKLKLCHSKLCHSLLAFLASPSAPSTLGRRHAGGCDLETVPGGLKARHCLREAQFAELGKFCYLWVEQIFSYEDSGAGSMTSTARH